MLIYYKNHFSPSNNLIYNQYKAYLMIIDNEKYTMADHIKKLCTHTKSLDIAVGYFYNNGFNLIEDCLSDVEKIRIVMGQDTSQKTIDDIADVKTSLGKHVNNGKIEIRIYETDRKTDRKFHGKTWIFHGKENTAIIGSSNCSINGLTKNRELNIIHNDIKEVKDWFNSIWEESTPYDYKKLKVMEKTFKKPENPTPKPETELEPFTLHEYQTEAIDKVTKALEIEEKCKLIMACGTGKTLVSIKIMEKIVSNDGVCVYFVPSISLIPQTLAQFKQNGKQEYDYHAVCSDSTAGQIEDDSSIDELKQEVKSSTNENELIKILKNHKKQKSKTPLVIFTVYNSYDKTNKALEKVGITPQLILYDEAHRTAGKKDGFASRSVHDVNAEKKIFMTATPRTYKNSKERDINSMDDVEIYGKIGYSLSFTEAVQLEKLVPFRIVLPEFKKNEVKDKKLAEKEKVEAMWKGIQYPNGTDSDFKLLQRVIAFHSTINASRVFAGKTKGNKKIEDYSMENIGVDENNRTSVKHVDSTMSASQRRREIDWIKDSNEDETECRILSNARCLQEGVDVPALDGVAFMNPKRSPVDIIQAIGRVMRKPKGFSKEYGYVILPIPIFFGSDIESQMRKDPTYKMVSDVISALLSHDDKLANLLDQTFLLNKGNPTGEQYTTRSFDEYLKKLIGNAKPSTIKTIRTVMLDLVDKTRFPRYGFNLGKKAINIEEDIKNQSTIKNIEIITKLQNELKNLINDSITLEDARKVLCQHAVLQPVFDQLFPESKKNNPVSLELDKTVKKLDIDRSDVQDTYDSIKNQVSIMDDPIVKQNFIRMLYDSFFKSADSKAFTKNGIVYTPVEAVDFILHSVSDVLKSEFDKSFSSNDVKILDPFTGTGMFVTRLLQSKLISENKLEDKYKNDIHCNDIELLAYYTALANIETSYQGIKNKREPFKNILYTDTFSQNPKYFEGGKSWTNQSKMFQQFSGEHELLKLQKKQKLNIIIGNPPYSAGQKIANEDNQNTSHDELEECIKDTYIKASPKGLQRSMYNSYIKAFRWASDRIGESGIIGFVTPASFITSNIISGMRKCLYEEFTDIYLLNLRGNANLSGDAGRKTGDNLFKGYSKEAIVITILVKNPNKQGCNIYYKEVDDYLKINDKLEFLKTSQSIHKIENWQEITPNKYHDWVDQRDEELDEKYASYMKIGDKITKGKKDTKALFNLFSGGLKTHRDAWVYNASQEDLEKNIKLTIDHINTSDINNFIKNDKLVAWSPILNKKLKKSGEISFDKTFIIETLFRPFTKHWLYSNPLFIDIASQIPKFFQFEKTEVDRNSFMEENIKGSIQSYNMPPPPPPTHTNPTIIVPDKINNEFSVFITNMMPDLEVVHHGQVFPIEVMDQ